MEMTPPSVTLTLILSPHKRSPIGRQGPLVIRQPSTQTHRHTQTQTQTTSTRRPSTKTHRHTQSTRNIKTQTHRQTRSTRHTETQTHRRTTLARQSASPAHRSASITSTQPQSSRWPTAAGVTPPTLPTHPPTSPISKPTTQPAHPTMHSNEINELEDAVIGVSTGGGTVVSVLIVIVVLYCRLLRRRVRDRERFELLNMSTPFSSPLHSTPLSRSSSEPIICDSPSDPSPPCRYNTRFQSRKKLFDIVVV